MIAILTCVSGCGWIFGKQDKPMHIQVNLTGSSDMNFDGKDRHPARVKLYLLASTAAFTQMDKDLFFNTANSSQLEDMLGKDILATGSVIVQPSQTVSVELEGRNDKIKKSKPVLCAIVDFYRSGGIAQERVVIPVPKKTNQTVDMLVGKDSIKKGRK